MTEHLSTESHESMSPAATMALAASVGRSLDGGANTRVLDLSHQRSKPRPGTLEIWIGPARS